MKLEALLLQHRDAILNRWFNLVVETYPGDSAMLYKKKADRFTNPIGHTIAQETRTLFDSLLDDIHSEKAHGALDNLIRVRAIQEFSPSEAVGFIISLKKEIREQLDAEIRDKQLNDELRKYESRIDDLALRAFDIFMECREKVYEIKVKELRTEKDMMFKLMERSVSGRRGASEEQRPSDEKNT